MALNPIVFTEKVVRSFLRYQLTAYPFADERLHAQMRRLLSSPIHRASCKGQVFQGTWKPDPPSWVTPAS